MSYHNPLLPLECHCSASALQRVADIGVGLSEGKYRLKEVEPIQNGGHLRLILVIDHAISKLPLGLLISWCVSDYCAECQK